MLLLPSFLAVVHPLSNVMTAPTYRAWLTLVTGWLLASRRTVTGMLFAAGVVGTRHHSPFHRVFSAARWSIDALGLGVFGLIDAAQGRPDTIWLTLDDTHTRKRGKRVFGAGMHYDPLISTRTRTVSTWGLNWVVLCIVVRLRCCPSRVFSLPVLCRLYLNKNAAARWRRVYRSKPELAVELLQRFSLAQRGRHMHAIVDSAYGGQSVLKRLPAACDLTSRLDLDARLYTAPPQRVKGRPGRPRKRGTLMPSPRKMLAQRGRRLKLDLYGRRDRVRLVECVAYCHHVPAIALKVVSVEPLVGGRPIQAFFSTVSSAEASIVLTWYARRWSVEETFAGAKSLLGMHQPQVWSRPAVERTTPVGLLLYSLVVLWFAKIGIDQWQPISTTWRRPRREPSFGDMLTTLRRGILRHNLVSEGQPLVGQTQKPQAIILELLARAA